MYLGNLNDFKEECIANDFNFEYKGKEYWLTFERRKFVAGECMQDEELLFDSFEDMFNNWKIEGEALKDIYKKIKKV